MEIIENTALKITVPEHIVPHITENIAKSEVIERNGNLAEMVIFWDVPEMTRLNQIVSSETIYLHPLKEIMATQVCIGLLIINVLLLNS